MHARPGPLPVACAAVLLTAGVFFSASIEQGLRLPEAAVAAESALDAPTFRIEHRSGQLQLAGTAGTADHESALLQLIADQFGASRAHVDLRPGVVLPDRWEAASLRLLYLLAATESGTGIMDSSRIMIRGVSSDSGALTSRLQFLREMVPAGLELDEDVIVIERSASLGELCRTSFANALDQPVEFRQSSAEIRTSSYAVLDTVIDIANDCRDSRIAITGHTDASGDATWNRRLSLARAQAVANYIIRGGIETDRLIVAGAGSSEPVADNSTARGRGQNRRIEFELR